jgi:hypothetical protein
MGAARLILRLWFNCSFKAAQERSVRHLSQLRFPSAKRIQRLGACCRSLRTVDGRSHYARLVYVICTFAFRVDALAAEEMRDAKANPLAAVSLDQLNETLRRPVFSAMRRPPASLAPSIVSRGVAPVPPPAPPKLTLVGIVTDGDGRWAIIKPENPDKMRILRVGDEFAGWKVAIIKARRLVMTLDRRSSAFMLFKADGASASKAVPPGRSRRPN